MRKNTQLRRTKWLTIRLSMEEERELKTLSARTTCQSISEYARTVLLKKSVTTLYRNQSADEFLSEMILLKNELNAIGNNFNQVVHKLHTLDNNPEIKTWAIVNEVGKQTLFRKVDEIREKLTQIYELWLQK